MFLHRPNWPFVSHEIQDDRRMCVCETWCKYCVASNSLTCSLLKNVQFYLLFVHISNAWTKPETFICMSLDSLRFPIFPHQQLSSFSSCSFTSLPLYMHRQSVDWCCNLSKCVCVWNRRISKKFAIFDMNKCEVQPMNKTFWLEVHFSLILS